MDIHLHIMLLAVITILAYLSAAFILSWNYSKKIPHAKSLVFIIGLIAVILQAALLHLQIDMQGGQNLSFSNMFSFVVWLIVLLVLFTSWRKPLENLMLLVFPLAAISILLLLIFPQQYLVTIDNDLKQLFHILFAALTFSVLCVAGLQAILLAILEKQLHKKTRHTIFHKFPPLETMESFLFQMIWLGFILLSIMICTSLYFFHDRVTWPLIQKIILAFSAWIIFGILLLGRFHYGWRGRKAIYGTLAGVLLILIIYFGSILLLGSLL